MSPDISVVVDHERLSLDAALVEKCVHQTLAVRNVGAAEISVVLTGRSFVLGLNRQFLDHDYPTDVLSFRLSEDNADLLTGEVYVDLDTAMERCAEFAATFESEVCRYVVHGVLHLLGFDDKTNALRAEMAKHEDAVLADVFGSAAG